jgi:hypothetical protein
LRSIIALAFPVSTFPARERTDPGADMVPFECGSLAPHRTAGLTEGIGMVALHVSLFLAVAIYLLICTVWGAILAVMRRPIGPSFRGSLRIAEGLILVQVVVGAVVFLSGAPHPKIALHYLYGLVILLALPAAETLAPQWWKGRHETLVITIGCLFAFGLSVRAAMTGAAA